MEKVTLKMARVKLGLTQDEMAKELGTSRVTYGKYEKYESPMRIDMAKKFSELVKIPIDHIIFFKQ